MKSLLLILLSVVTYTNPIIYADYSDPDAIRVGSDYYMTSSSFNCYPGLQILHSVDLVNWDLINAALPRAYATEHDVEHGNFVWAPSIRQHNDMFYIFWGDPDRGIYYVNTKDIRGTWSEPQLLLEGKGYIDPCPYWNNDTLYIVHALAGSRAGLKSVLLMASFAEKPDYREPRLFDHRIIYDGHKANPTCEGPKIYHRNGWYYIFTPAGGVATGWQLVLRSHNIYGPYEEKVVLSQGSTNINGPHQGAWVTTETGEDWFLHFQDVGAVGRIVHLQPMKWTDDWPVIGNNGEPVLTYQAPEKCTQQKKQKTIVYDFTENTLDYSWQYPHSPDVKWHFCDAKQGVLRLFSVPQSQETSNLWEQPNMLLRKIDAPNFTATAKVRFNPAEKIVGERAGLIVMGLDYAALMIEKTTTGLIAYTAQCNNAKNNTQEIHSDTISVSPQKWIYIKLIIKNGQAEFALSDNNQSYNIIGTPFTLKEGVWIGAKYGFVCTRPSLNALKTRNDGGWLDIDQLKIDY